MKKTTTQMLSLVVLLLGLQSLSAQEQILTVNAPSGISGVLEMGEAALEDGWSGTLMLGEQVTGDVTYVESIVDPDDDLDDTPVMGCLPLGNSEEVAGKIALIERGACSFSSKVNWAQEAGAIGVVICNNRPESEEGGGIVNMLASEPYINTDTIPSGFLSQEDCAALRLALDNGETLNVTLGTKVFSDLAAGNTYRTPLAAVIPLVDMRVTIYSVEDAEADITWVVTDPTGAETTITTTGTATLAGPTFIPDPGTEYTPSMMGIHTVVASNSINDVVLETTFDITEDVFALDDGVVTTSGSTSLENFTAPVGGTAYRTDIGMLMHLTDTELELTSIEFGMANWSALQENAQDDVNFNIVLFAAPLDADGNVAPIQNEITTYADFGSPLAFAIYAASGNETDGDIVSISDFNLTEPNPDDTPLFRFQPNESYYVFIQYDGTNVANDVPPAYLLGKEIGLVGNQSPVVTSDWFNFWGNGNSILRANVQDPLIIDNVEYVLADNAVIVNPNPISSKLNVAIDLENSSDKVVVQVINLTGMVVVNETFDNLQSANLSYDMTKYPAGNYFIKVATQEGTTIKKVVKQ